MIYEDRQVKILPTTILEICRRLLDAKLNVFDGRIYLPPTKSQIRDWERFP